MTINQAAEAVNSITSQILGESAVLSEDLSNLVDIGQQVLNGANYDNFVRALPDAIGRVIFVDRIYEARTFGLFRDGNEWGALTEKIDATLPEAEDSEAWALRDGQSYDPNVFRQPDVSVKFWNKFQTFTIPYSIARKQVRSAFTNSGAFLAFFNMLEVKVRNASELKMEGLARATLVGAMAEAIHAGGAQVVNVLSLYNTAFPEATLTAANYRYSPEFWRFFAATVMTVSDHLEDYSTLFNAAKSQRFSPKSRQNVVLLSDARNYANAYLQSGVFHDQFTRLPDAKSINYWQGTGTGYDWASQAKIEVTSPSGQSVSQDGVLGAILDHDAAGVTNLSNETRAQYNAPGDFVNYWLEHFAGYRIDTGENCVVFVAADD